MFPDRFEYLAPTSVEEAISALVEHGYEAKILAGGQSLLPMMKLRLATPAVLIDLGRIADLAGISDDGERIQIGAMTSEASLESSQVLQKDLPILVDTSSVIADPLVRNLATVGGNVAHGDPANDHPATMLALGAEFSIQSPDGVRTVPADDFFVDFFTTAIEPNEILTEIRLPRPDDATGSAYVKHERQAGDYAIAGAAVRLSTYQGQVDNVRIALTNLGSTPVRPDEAEELLQGEQINPDLANEAGRAAAAATDAWSDSRGSAEYRRRVAARVTASAIEKAWRRANNGNPG